MSSESLNELSISLDNINDNSIPPWALLLITSMKSLIDELKGFNELIHRVTRLEDFKAVSETVTARLDANSIRLEAENSRLNKVVNNLELRIDDQEQRSRNKCLLIHGCEENVREDTDVIVLSVINEKMNLANVTIDDIERSHRLGPKKERRTTRSNQNKSRPIIVKFVNFRKRKLVFKNKSSLKGENVSISENLTKTRYELYQASMKKYGRGNVWTMEGRVTTKVEGEYVVINCMDDLA